MICSKCRVLCEGKCPVCESAKHLREPEPNEAVHLITLTAMQAMLVEPILAQTGVPYIKQGVLGGGLSAQLGMMLETFRFLVPLSGRERCRAAIEDVFGEDEQLMRLLHEFDRNQTSISTT